MVATTPAYSACCYTVWLTQSSPSANHVAAAQHSRHACRHGPETQLLFRTSIRNVIRVPLTVGRSLEPDRAVGVSPKKVQVPWDSSMESPRGPRIMVWKTTASQCRTPGCGETDGRASVTTRYNILPPLQQVEPRGGCGLQRSLLSQGSTAEGKIGNY